MLVRRDGDTGRGERLLSIFGSCERMSGGNNIDRCRADERAPMRRHW